MVHVWENERTRGEVEASIAGAVVRFQREQQGRGPVDVRAHVLGDLVVVRCTGIFTPTEARLAGTKAGCCLIRSARQELRAIHQIEIEQVVSALAGSRVLRSYCDVDVKAAEQIEVYVLESPATTMFSDRYRGKRGLRQPSVSLKGTSTRYA
jgi:uncharacterized protein YbcI